MTDEARPIDAADEVAGDAALAAADPNEDGEPGAVDRLYRGLLPENPVHRQLLGMCPTLAVTATVASALTLGLATVAVLVASSLAVSLLRRWIADHVRILVYTVVIASLVTLVDRGIAATLPDLHRALGPYVPLIIVNCVIIGRAEACARRSTPVVALADALGQGGGFLLGLASLAIVRELLATRSVLGWRVLPDAFEPWVIMALPPGAFFTLGLLIAAGNAWRDRGEPESATGTREGAPVSGKIEV